MIIKFVGESGEIVGKPHGLSRQYELLPGLNKVTEPDGALLLKLSREKAEWLSGREILLPGDDVMPTVISGPVIAGLDSAGSEAPPQADTAPTALQDGPQTHSGPTLGRLTAKRGH